MRRVVNLILMVCLIAVIAGCGGKKQVKTQPAPVPPSPGEKLLWTSGERPEWLVNEPEVEGIDLFFVGLSGNHATEQGARDDALKNAVTRIVGYLGTFAQDKLQSIVTSYGLSSQIVDPTTAARGFKEILAAGMTRRVRTKTWYLEKWQNQVGDTYWKAYVLAKVPASSIDEAYKETAETQKKAMKDAYDQAKEEKAKKQYQQAMDAFDDAAKKGFGPIE